MPKLIISQPYFRYQVFNKNNNKCVYSCILMNRGPEMQSVLDKELCSSKQYSRVICVYP